MSAHYVTRKGSRRYRMRRYPKLTVACETETHLWLSAHVCMGPCQDSPQFTPVIEAASGVIPIGQLLADKGYDAEHNHRLCREELGIPSTVIPVRKRSKLSPNPRKWPETPYRREMKRSFDKKNYGQRWQVESAFSQHKRRFGSWLSARSWPTQQTEIRLRVVTHNVALLAA